MILLLDNYDSFTYNIVQYLEQLHADVIVYKNDAIDITTIEKLQPQALVLGPGPGTPNNAGITLKCISHFAGKLPILGVCLGHQAIAQAFGAQVVKAEQVMHGRTSSVYHDQMGVFEDVTSPTAVTRYHSLLVDKASLPDMLEVTAWTTKQDSNFATDATDDKIYEIMALRHKQFAIEGVQFHPESILSQSGLQIFNNFLIAHHLVNPVSLT